MNIPQRSYGLLFIVLYCGFGFMGLAQTNLQTTIVNSGDDFNKVRESFLIAEKRYRADKIKVAATLYDSLISAEKWADLHGTTEQKLQSAYQVHFYYDQSIDDVRIIATGKKLLANKDFLEFPESAFVARATLDALNRRGFYTKQLELFPVFEKLNEMHGFNVLSKSFSYHRELGMIHYKLGNYDLARENFMKQLENFRSANDFFRAASSSNNIALTYERENNLMGGNGTL